MKAIIIIFLFVFQLFAYAQIDNNKKPSQLLFMENKGQVANQDGTARPDVLFSSNSGGARLYFTANSIYYQFAKASTKSQHTAKDIKDQFPQKFNYATHRYTFQLEGSNPHPVIIKDAETPYTENFYLAHCPQGVTGVKSYRKIVYKDVYPGIDWVLYSKGQFFEYDFVVHPGANPAAIRFTISGADATAILPQGQLKVTTRLGNVTEKKPISFDSKGISISTNFIQHADKSFGFEGKFPRNEKVVIDPEVVWMSSLSAPDTDIQHSVEDINQNVYFDGNTTSPTGIAENGFNNFYAGQYDIYVRKLSPAGSLLWCTYYGGEETDDLTSGSLSVDSAGNVFLTGITSSTANLSFNGFQNERLGLSDALLVKFSPAGNRIWATYYGGNFLESTSHVITDENDNVYLAMHSSSPGLQTDSSVFRGVSDCVIAKFDNNGNRLWSRYFGGEEWEMVRNMIKDSEGNIILTGYTFSDLYISSTEPTIPQENETYFIAKFTSTGNVLWSRYDDADCSSLTCDSSNNIYQTLYYYANGPYSTSMVTKLDPNGVSMPFQQSSEIYPGDAKIAIANGHIYLHVSLSSVTNYNNLIGPPCQPPGEFINSSSTLYKSTLSGSLVWQWRLYVHNAFIGAGAGGNLYLHYNSMVDEMMTIGVAKIHEPSCTAALPAAATQSYFCPGATVASLSATGTGFTWYDSNGNVLSMGTLLPEGNSNIYVSQTVNGCESEKRYMMATIYPVTPLPVAQAQSFCGSKKINNIAITGANIKWYANPEMGILLGANTTITTGTYYATQTLNGCESLPLPVPVTITITPPPVVPPFSSCTPATLGDIPFTAPDLKYYTTATGGTPLPLTTPINNNVVYYASQTVNGCESAHVQILAKAYNMQTPTGSQNQTLCYQSTLGNIAVSGTYPKKYYTTPTGGVALPATTILYSSGTYYISQATGNPYNCESPRLSVNVTVLPQAPAPIAPATQSFCYGATVGDLAVQGTGITWYRNNTTVTGMEMLYSGQYVARQNVNGCLSGFTIVQVTVTTPSIPTVPGGTFNSCSGAMVASLTATGTNLKWYTSATATTPLAPTDLLASGTYYVSQTINGCESQRASKAVTITNVSLPQAPASQTFCGGAKVSNLSATGQNKKWYMSASGGSALANTDLLQSGTYYVSQTVNNCESSRLPVTVTVNIIAPPVGDTLQIIQAAPGAQPTLEALQVTGTSVSWYTSPSGAFSGYDPLPSSTILTSGSTYYAIRVQNGCKSEYLAVTVTIVLGIDDFKTQDFSYFPNPVSGSLTIKAPVSLSVIKVYNTLGQQVLQAKPDAIETSIDFSGLAAGVYIIDAAAGTTTVRFRVIKN